MTIREIITFALRKIGREDIANAMGKGNPAGEQGDVVDTLLYCVNATEDELARYYFPLVATETLSSANGRHSLSYFRHTPVRIVSVKSGGKECSYRLETDALIAPGGAIEVTYHYAPAKKTISGNSEFSDGNMVALGAAAEYCLICGETSLAEVWETRYREAIDRAQSMNSKGAYVPPRRWV